MPNLTQVWAKILGMWGRAISERPVCHPQIDKRVKRHQCLDQVSQDISSLEPRPSENLLMVLWNILRQKNNLFIIVFVIIPDRQFQLFPTVHPGTLLLEHRLCLVDLTLLAMGSPLLVHMHRSLRSSSKAFVSTFVPIWSDRFWEAGRQAWAAHRLGRVEVS